MFLPLRKSTVASTDGSKNPPLKASIVSCKVMVEVEGFFVIRATSPDFDASSLCNYHIKTSGLSVSLRLE